MALRHRSGKRRGRRRDQGILTRRPKVYVGPVLKLFLVVTLRGGVKMSPVTLSASASSIAAVASALSMTTSSPSPKVRCTWEFGFCLCSSSERLKSNVCVFLGLACEIT